MLSEQLTLYKKEEAKPLGSILTQLKRASGNGNILIPQIVSSHKPEGKFQLDAFTPERKQGNKEDLNPPFSFSQNSITVLRLHNPPKPATVRAEDGMIKFVITDSWYGEVVKQRGPWEISGEWWSEDYDRCYFEIELSDGEQYLIFFENSSKRWFLQGIFD